MTGSSRSAKDFFTPLAVGAPAPLREIPARPSRAIHFFDPGNPKMAAKVPDMVGTVDVLLGNLEDAVKAENKEVAREGLVKIARETDFGPTQLWTRINSLDSPWVARRPDHAGHRDRRQARRDHGAEGAGCRGHPLRRPDPGPARGEGRPGEAAARARDPRDRPRRGERRGDLRLVPADAGPDPRPGRPGRRPPDEDHARRRRPPRLPGAPGPPEEHSRRHRQRRSADDVPAGPVALHDRADGRRLRDARHLSVLRAVRRHRRRGGVRGPVPQRLPARLRRRLVPAPEADRDRQQGLLAPASTTSSTRAAWSPRWATAPAR